MRAVLASTRAELLRLRRWPVLWILLGVWITLNLSFVYLFTYLAYRTGATSPSTEGLSPEALLTDILPTAVPQALVQGMPLFGGAIMMILGALAVGSGYGWGTWKTSFTQGPGRLPVLGGTFVALGVIVVGVTLTTAVIDLGVASAITAVESQPVVMPALGELITAVGAGLLVLAMWTAAGALLGAVAQSPALAVGLGLVWALVVENLLRGVSGLLDSLSVVTDHLPGTAAGSLVGALNDDPTDFTPGVLSILDGASAGWVLTAYLLAFVGASLLLVQRRDLA